MTKQEFLSASLPYGLKVTFEADEYNHSIVGVECNYVTLISHFNDYGRAEIQKTIPIVRPLSDLTKECVQTDYNDGKPFVPIVELNKLFNPYDGMELVYYINSGLGWRIDSSRCNTAITFDMMIKPIKQLLKWHFDLITEDCEKVYVTDEFNPYK